MCIRDSEADIEAHGPFMIYRKEDTDYKRFKRWNEKIADDPVWEEADVYKRQESVLPYFLKDVH